MISKEEHHRFMESLRQSLPHHSSADSVKSLREPLFCDGEEDEAEIIKILDEIFGALSEPNPEDQCAAAADADT